MVTYHDGGKAVTDAFIEHHGYDVSSGPAISVTQHVGEIGPRTIISDGPMEHTSETREEGLLPSQGTNAALAGNTLVVGNLETYPDL